MKNAILTFLLQFLLIHLYSQEKLTNYNDENNTITHSFFHNSNGHNFLTFIDKLDNVFIYEIVEEQLVFKKKMNDYGISSATNFIFTENLLVFTTSIGLNCINLSEEEYPLYSPIASNIKIIDSYKDLILITGSQLTNSERFNKVVGKYSFYEDPPGNMEALRIHNTDVFCRNIINGKSEYYLFNITKNTLDYLIDLSPKKNGIDFFNDNAYYLDIDNELWNFNLQTRERDNLKIFSAYSKFQNQLKITDNEVYIYNGSADSAFVEIFNVNTRIKAKEWKFPAKGIVSDKYFTVVDDNILLKTLNGQITILNKDSEEIKHFESLKEYSFKSWPIVENRYLLFPGPKSINVYDLKNEKLTSLNIDIDTKNTYGVSFAALGNEILISFINSNIDFPHLFSFDKTNELLKPYNVPLNNTFGFHQYSEIHTLNNKIVIGGKDIIAYDGAEEKINDFTLADYRGNYNTFQDDKLLFIEFKDDDYNFYSYDGETLQNEAKTSSISSSIRGIYNTNKYFYFAENSNLYQIEKVNNKRALKVNNIPNYPSPIVYKDELYFIQNFSLKKINNDGVIKIIHTFKSNENRNTQLIINEGYLYLFNDYFAYSFKDDVLKEIYAYPNAAFIDFYKTRRGNLIIQNFSNYQMIKADSTIEISRSENEFFPTLIKKAEKFTIYSNQSEGKFFIMDEVQKKFFEMDNKINLNNLVDVYLSNQDTVAIINEQNYLVNYKLSNNFSSSEKISEIAFGKPDFKADAFEYEGKVLLMSTNDIFFIDQNHKLIKVESIKGVANSLIKVIKDDGYFYFLAENPEDGIQLYRINTDLINNTESINPEILISKIYPNPSSNQIHFTNKNINLVEIYNSDGQLILSQKDIGDSGLEISDLKIGMYIAVIKSNDKIESLKFIKSN